MQKTSVLIIGGSLVGLSASLFLAWRRVPHVLVEKHRGSSPHPRAMGFTETSLEHFRAVGIADRIPQVSPGTRLRRIQVTSLTGEWSGETFWTPGAKPERPTELSPCSGAALAQDRLEPILREAARALGAEMQLGVELISFGQSPEGVLARLRPRDGSPELEVAADYLIAADGAGSPVREQLGIRRSGVGHLRTLRSVLFRCPEADPYLEKGFQQFEIDQPEGRSFLTSYGDGRWVLMFDDDRERSEPELQTAVQRALGRAMPFEILTTGRWEMAGRIADRYQAGRIFLAGDAAHQLPPTRGGFGANTGIADVWNLAWKLERVLAGTSLSALLDTYEAERRAIGWLRHQQTFSRPDYARWVDERFAPEPLLGDAALELGQLVRSAAVLGAGPELPAARAPEEWAGQPGTRAPHFWIRSAGARLSTLDLFGRDYVLLAGSPDWANAARKVGLQAVQVGGEVEGDGLRSGFGIGDAGASLVRPDGIIAWRTEQSADAKTLARVFARVAARDVPRPRCRR